MKKQIAILICFALLATSLVACTKPAGSQTPTAKSEVTPSSNSDSSKEADSSNPVTDPEIAFSTRLEDIQAKGELVIGLDDTFAPMGFREQNGDLVGFDIDLANAVCEELGVKAKFQPIDWNAKELELNSGKVDCIWNGMSMTPDRQASMNLSQPYLNNIICVMSIQGVSIRSAADLQGHTIGVQSGSAALEAVKSTSIYKTIETSITEYATYDEVILDMQAGRLDCMIIDEVYGSYKNAKLNNVFVVSPFDFGDDLYVIGFRKTDSDLCEAVNDALKKLNDDGISPKISNKWFGADIVVKQ